MDITTKSHGGPGMFAGSNIGLNAANSYNQNVTTACETKAPPVFDALQSVDIQINVLENQWAELLGRLTPVYRQELGNSATDSCKSAPASCDMEARIRTQQDRIANIANGMASILNKLCV